MRSKSDCRWKVAAGVAMAAACTLIHAVAPHPDIPKSVEGRTFQITDPVGCVTWVDVSYNQKRLRNNCTTRVEVVACGIGADSIDCSLPVQQLKYKMTTLDPHPPKPGNYGTEHAVNSSMSPPPKVVGVVACPIETGRRALEGQPTGIWQVEKAGGLLAGKCITVYDGHPPASQVKIIDWPFYAIDGGYEGRIPVRVVEQPGNVRNQAEFGASRSRVAGADSAGESGNNVKVETAEAAALRLHLAARFEDSAAAYANLLSRSDVTDADKRWLLELQAKAAEKQPPNQGSGFSISSSLEKWGVAQSVSGTYWRSGNFIFVVVNGNQLTARPTSYGISTCDWSLALSRNSGTAWDSPYEALKQAASKTLTKEPINLGPAVFVIPIDEGYKAADFWLTSTVTVAGDGKCTSYAHAQMMGRMRN